MTSIDSPAVLVERDGKLCQPVRLSIRHAGQPAEATVAVTGAEPVTAALKHGTQEIEVAVPAVEKETAVAVAVKSAGKTLAERQITLKPVRKWVVYLLPHSHVDIGYTHFQADVEKKQWSEHRHGVGPVPQDGRLSARGAVQVERRSALGGGQLPAQGAAGKAAAADRRHPRRRRRTRRPVRQRVDRPVPAGGTAAADAVGRPRSADAAA